MSYVQLPHDHGQKMEEMLVHAPDAENFQALSEMFRQLSDGTRLHLFGCCVIARNVLPIFPQ